MGLQAIFVTKNMRKLRRCDLKIEHFFYRLAQSEMVAAGSVYLLTI